MTGYCHAFFDTLQRESDLGTRTHAAARRLA